MALESISPNMNLILPGVGLTLGPTWAQDLNDSFTIIDQHTHAPGSGVQITPAGLNISADLSFQSNNATNLRTIRLAPQSAAPALASDIGCLYEVGVDLFYTDGNGTSIRITQSGGIAGTPGSISGLTSPASASYVSGSSTFVWQSGANLSANMDFGNAIFRNFTVNSKGLTVQPPSAMAADYTLTLPTLPVAQSFLTLDSFGNIAPAWVPDYSTIVVASNLVKVNTDGVSLTAAGPIAIRNLYMEREFTINGFTDAIATYPATAVDGYLFFQYDATITSVWIYNLGNGTSGTTELDLKVGTSGGSFASILSTTGKVDSTAAANVYTDSGSVVSAQTGVTKPVISGANVSAGQALRLDLIQSMVGGANCGVIVHYVAR